MRAVFYKFGDNLLRIFRGRNILWHLLAAFLTYLAVMTGLDWKYYVKLDATNIPKMLFPAVVLGGLVPIFLPIVFYIWGKMQKSVRLRNTASAIVQAAFFGWAISSFYKALTGRLEPPRVYDALMDASGSFQFGFLRHGIFWGWPSSHTTVAFAVGVALFTMYPKNRIVRVLSVVYALYVGIGVSMSIHWFSDFLAGAIIGSVIGYVVGRAFLLRPFLSVQADRAAKLIADSVIYRLDLKKRVLWLIPGGSAIRVAVEAAKIISEYVKKSGMGGALVVMQTDERYGPVGHPDSNWREIMESGFGIPGAKMLPVLVGGDRETTNKKFGKTLSEEFGRADYKLGLFGIGADGHTAGILPRSPAVHASGWSAEYDAGKFERITVTPETIVKLDEAVVFAEGEEKWPVIRDLKENSPEIPAQPAQILKKVPLLTIYTDYK